MKFIKENLLVLSILLIVIGFLVGSMVLVCPIIGPCFYVHDYYKILVYVLFAVGFLSLIFSFILRLIYIFQRKK